MIGSKPSALKEVMLTMRKLTSQMYSLQGELGSREEYASADHVGGHCDILRGWLAEVYPPEASQVDRNALANPVPRKSMELKSPIVNRSGQSPSRTIKRSSRVKPGEAIFTRVGVKFLVRSGVSKKSKDEYRHFAPYDLIADLAHACLACTATGTPSFSMKDLKSNKNLKKKEHSVGYYYDVLKWFAQMGFVERAGLRGRYKLGRVCELVNDPFDLLRSEFEKLQEEIISG